jgi:hypothetical protein
VETQIASKKRKETDISYSNKTIHVIFLREARDGCS